MNYIKLKPNKDHPSIFYHHRFNPDYQTTIGAKIYTSIREPLSHFYSGFKKYPYRKPELTRWRMVPVETIGSFKRFFGKLYCCNFSFTPFIINQSFRKTIQSYAKRSLQRPPVSVEVKKIS